MNEPTESGEGDARPPGGRKRSRRKWYFLIGVGIGIVGGYALLRHLGIDFTSATNKTRTKDHPAWAEKLDRPGLPNLHRVSDALYRGARPEPDGYGTLKAMGVRTVVNLQHWHDDAKECEAAGLANVNIEINTWNLRDEHVVAFLKVMSDPARQPVFVHCKHGSDRTGTMCVMYRIFFQGWSKEAALDEMRNGGFGYHEMWENLERCIQRLDVDAIRAKAGLAAPATTPAGD